MTEHDLKEMKNLGAELGAAKAENDRLRGLLTKALEFTEANTCGGPDVAQLIAEMRAALYRQADHVRDAPQMMVPSEIIKAIAWGDRDDAAEAIGSLRCLLADPEGEDEIAFPDSSEPTDTYTAVDMATAAAQGFRDGQAAVEPAPAQDERELPPPYGWVSVGKFFTDREKAIEAAEKTPCIEVYSRPQMLTRPAQTEQHDAEIDDESCPECEGACSDHCGPCRQCAGEGTFEAALRHSAPIEQTAPQSEFGDAYQGAREDLAIWKRRALEAEQKVRQQEQIIDHLILEAQGETRMGEPVIPQTAPQPEQEPFWYAVVSEQAPTINSAIKRLDVAQEFADSKREHWPDTRVVPLYAAPIAQTAPQGKFRMGDLVKKSTGSEWEGRVVGTYSTEQTKEGYAVESEAHAGSVQIYPAKALEAVDD